MIASFLNVLTLKNQRPNELFLKKKEDERGRRGRRRGKASSPNPSFFLFVVSTFFTEFQLT